MSQVTALNEVMKMNQQSILIVAIFLSVSVQSAWAENEVIRETMQEMDHSTMHSMDHSTAGEMDHSKMPGMDHSTSPIMDHSKTQGMDHSVTHDMSDSAMQGGSAPEDARDPHAYSDGYTLDSGKYALPGPRILKLGDEHNFGSLLIDRLESARTSDATSTVYDLQAWYGRDYDRAVFKAEGHIEDGKLEEGSAELLWGHALTAYWNTNLGIRHDSNEETNRNWLAFGVQGLAPYWFEMDATVYVGGEGRSVLNFEAEYEIPFTQKLILQPRVEANIYGKEDVKNGIGSGLSELAVGIRLRYEIKRELGPYIGVEWESLQGETASMARNMGLDTKETKAIAGVRFWF